MCTGVNGGASMSTSVIPFSVDWVISGASHLGLGGFNGLFPKKVDKRVCFPANSFQNLADIRGGSARDEVGRMLLDRICSFKTNGSPEGPAISS